MICVRWFLVLLLLVSLGCESSKPPKASGPDGTGGDGTSGSGGVSSAEGSGGESSAEPGGPSFHPPPGFESCIHAEVRADCNDGWCRIPAGCFVMGSPEGQWHRAYLAEQQVAVTLTHPFVLQQTEMTRQQWFDLVGVDPGSDPYFPEQVCLDDDCPITHITWWDAIHAANLMNDTEGLPHCIEPVDCTGTPGNGLACEGVADPDKSVYDCEGYRLPTRHEFEYSAKAGTTTPFYSGDITVYEDHDCHPDANLEKIAWFCHNSGRVPHPVGRLDANGFGLHDMLGNVLEMGTDPYSTASSPGGSDPQGSLGTHSNRLSYGAAYHVPNWTLRVTGRYFSEVDGRSAAQGLRLARTLFEEE